MKLAEALAERADLQKRVEQTKARLKNNAWVQEGERPAEDPTALEKELFALCDQLEKLVTRINLTNAAAIEDGLSITALLARRDTLSTYVAGLRDFLDEASRTPVRAARGEIRILPTVNVQEYRKKADALSKELRGLDMRIQRLNWTTDLM
ncbi:MAG: DIP1984 family protein [Clostridia bacterium]|nr:DIP1984 family protein [Clostridia bacterium]